MYGPEEFSISVSRLVEAVEVDDATLRLECSSLLGLHIIIP